MVKSPHQKLSMKVQSCSSFSAKYTKLENVNTETPTNITKSPNSLWACFKVANRDWSPAKCRTNLNTRRIRVTRTNRTTFPAFPIIWNSERWSSTKENIYGKIASKSTTFKGWTKKISFLGAHVNLTTYSITKNTAVKASIHTMASIMKLRVPSLCSDSEASESETTDESVLLVVGEDPMRMSPPLLISGWVL